MILYIWVGSESSQSPERHFEVLHEQQEFLWFAVIKQGHFKLVEIRLFWRRISTQFNFTQYIYAFVSFIIFINGIGGGFTWVLTALVNHNFLCETFFTEDDTFMSYYYYSDLDFKDNLQAYSTMLNPIIQCKHDLIFHHMILNSN